MIHYLEHIVHDITKSVEYCLDGKKSIVFNPTISRFSVPSIITLKTDFFSKL